MINFEKRVKSRNYDLKMGENAPKYDPSKVVDVAFTPPQLTEDDITRPVSPKLLALIRKAKAEGRELTEQEITDIAQLGVESIPDFPELPPSEGVPPKIEDDYIPMHWEPGQTFQHQINHGDGSFTLLKFKVIKEHRGQVFMEDKHGAPHYLKLDTNEVFALTDRNRCSICGQFLCECNLEPTETMRSNQSAEPVSFAELNDYKHNQPIDAVIVFIKEEYKVNEGRGNKGPYYYHDYLVEDLAQDELKLTVSGADAEFPQDCKGKFYLIESKVGQRSSSGVKLVENTYKGETTIKIQVTASRILTEVDEQGRPVDSQPSGRAASGSRGGNTRQASGRNQGRQNASNDPPADAPPARSAAPARSTGSSSRKDDGPTWLDTFEQRLELWMFGFKLTCDRLGLSVESAMQTLSADKVAEINMGIMRTFDHGYMKLPPFFSEEGAPAPKLSASAPVAQPTNWKTYVHKTAGPLGEADEPKLVDFAAWVMALDSEKLAALKEDTKIFVKNILAMIAEKGWTPEHLINKWLDNHGLNDQYDEHDVVAMLKAKFNADKLQDLSSASVRKFFATREDIVKELTEAHAAAQGDDIPT